MNANLSAPPWINPNTGKGWTDDEEAAFAQIQTVSRLNRIKAIHLWKRCRKNTERALAVAERDYPQRPPKSEAQLDAAAKARQVRNAPTLPLE